MSVLEEIRAERELREATLEYKRLIDDDVNEGFAILHFWKGKLGWRWNWFWPLYFQFGHVSLTLSNGIHISFWSTGTGERSYNDTIDEDIVGENRLPDSRVKIPTHRRVEHLQGRGRNPTDPAEDPTCVLDENKVKVWWESYKNVTVYGGLTNNCAQTVSRALMYGEFAKDEMLQLLKDMKRKQYEVFSKSTRWDLPSENLRRAAYQIMFQNILTDIEHNPEAKEINCTVLDDLLNQSAEYLLNVVDEYNQQAVTDFQESALARTILTIFCYPNHWSMLEGVWYMPTEKKKALIESLRESLRQEFLQGETCDSALTPAGIYNAVQEKLGADKIKKVLIIF